MAMVMMLQRGEDIVSRNKHRCRTFGCAASRCGPVVGRAGAASTSSSTTASAASSTASSTSASAAAPAVVPILLGRLGGSLHLDPLHLKGVVEL